MKVSIVMATYNGEKYIVEQLESIYNQSMKADEVLISDDCSTDNTILIVKKFIEKYELKNWHLFVNERNKGWEKNFIDILKLATGNLIFLSDQDDIWHNDKIKEMSEIMLDNEHILLLASNYKKIYGNKKRKHNIGSSNFSVKRYIFREDYLFVKRPGCTYCLRNTLIERSLDFWIEKYPHDALFWHFANASNGLYLYNKRMVDYRMHDCNASIIRHRDITIKLNSMKICGHVIKYLMQMSNEKKLPNSDLKLYYIEKSMQWYKNRIILLEQLQVLKWFVLIPYYKYYYSGKSFLGDLYYVLLKMFKNISENEERK